VLAYHFPPKAEAGPAFFFPMMGWAPSPFYVCERPPLPPLAQTPQKKKKTLPPWRSSSPPPFVFRIRNLFFRTQRQQWAVLSMTLSLLPVNSLHLVLFKEAHLHEKKGVPFFSHFKCRLSSSLKPRSPSLLFFRSHRPTKKFFLILPPLPDLPALGPTPPLWPDMLLLQTSFPPITLLPPFLGYSGAPFFSKICKPNDLSPPMGKRFQYPFHVAYVSPPPPLKKPFSSSPLHTDLKRTSHLFKPFHPPPSGCFNYQDIPKKTLFG